jgi:hypothetical protein
MADNLLRDLTLMLKGMNAVKQLDSETALFSGKVPYGEYVVVEPGGEKPLLYSDDAPFGIVESATIRIFSKGSYMALKDEIIGGIRGMGRTGSIVGREYKGVMLVGDGLKYCVYEIGVEFLYPGR